MQSALQSYRSVSLKAFEVRKDFVEEIFGLNGLEFKVIMRRVKTEHTVAHQRQCLDRCYFREWDRLEYLLEKSLAIEASSFVRQHKLTVMLGAVALAHFFTDPAFEMAFKCFPRQACLVEMS